MKDDALILAAWADAVRRNESAILATVVKVSGSAYRKPGARMLITRGGGRVGSISGGCLEGDILKKAWWLTSEPGVAMQVYDNTSEEDAIWEFGLGCNGIVHVLLERWDTGAQPLTADLLAACQAGENQSGVLATVIAGPLLGQKLALFPDSSVRSEVADPLLASEMERTARAIAAQRESEERQFGLTGVFFEFVQPPVSLVIVGAGQDALPVVRLAKELGWHVTVVDGRSSHARPDRFPEADRVSLADLDHPLDQLSLTPLSAAVLMSHSFDQDRIFLGALHARGLRYVGVLGPRKRTERMLADNQLTDFPELHSPVGLDVGAETPEEIALSIVSEIQAAMTGYDGGKLKQRAGPIHRAESRSVPA